MLLDHRRWKIFATFPSQYRTSISICDAEFLRLRVRFFQQVHRRQLFPRRRLVFLSVVPQSGERVVKNSRRKKERHGKKIQPRRAQEVRGLSDSEDPSYERIAIDDFAKMEALWRDKVRQGAALLKPQIANVAKTPK